MNSAKPPRLAAWLLQHFGPQVNGEALAGAIVGEDDPLVSKSTDNASVGDELCIPRETLFHDTKPPRRFCGDQPIVGNRWQ